LVLPPGRLAVIADPGVSSEVAGMIEIAFLR
jgi:hypothetical protein